MLVDGTAVSASVLAQKCLKAGTGKNREEDCMFGAAGGCVSENEQQEPLFIESQIGCQEVLHHETGEPGCRGRWWKLHP